MRIWGSVVAATDAERDFAPIEVLCTFLPSLPGRWRLRRSGRRVLNLVVRHVHGRHAEMGVPVTGEVDVYGRGRPAVPFMLARPS